jgi:hypothetical protein
MLSPTNPIFVQGVLAAERCARQGMPINAETLSSEDPELPILQADELVHDPRFARALEEIGVNFKPFARLSNDQLAAIRIYLSSGGRTHASRLRAAGVSATKWAGWMRQPRFRDYIAQGGIDRINDSLVGAQMSLADRAEAGESWAVNLVFQLTGFHDPNKVEDPRPIFEAIFEELSDAGVDEEILRRVAGRVRNMLDPAGLQQAQPAMIMANPAQKAS